MRPHVVPTGAHTGMLHVRWKSWGGENAVGYGRLLESGGCCDESFNLPAKIRVSFPGECAEGGNGRFWYSEITITYGPDFKRRYLRQDPIGPCA